MKSARLFLLTMMCFFSVNSVFAAEIVSDNKGKVKIGVVSSSGATTLDELIEKISSEADKRGATSFKMLSVTGNNKLHGVAETYQ